MFKLAMNTSLNKSIHFGKHKKMLKKKYVKLGE